MPALVHHFLAQLGPELGLESATITDDALAAMAAADAGAQITLAVRTPSHPFESMVTHEAQHVPGAERCGEAAEELVRVPVDPWDDLAEPADVLGIGRRVLKQRMIRLDVLPEGV